MGSMIINLYTPIISKRHLRTCGLKCFSTLTTNHNIPAMMCHCSQYIRHHPNYVDHYYYFNISFFSDYMKENALKEKSGSKSIYCSTGNEKKMHLHKLNILLVLAPIDFLVPGILKYSLSTFTLSGYVIAKCLKELLSFKIWFFFASVRQEAIVFGFPGPDSLLLALFLITAAGEAEPLDIRVPFGSPRKR